ncbi:ester cyclase [Thermococcus argininiproducens]|uniref:Ester cyclase n=2 Tax=Thermococcus argininiproducens TaxID=2866384 RepID=A0A9E7SDL2_9EURY|nr:ester cyclase [Thermococcus argininiproducens]
MRAEKERIIQQSVDELWNKGDVSLADRLYAPNFINHDPSNPDVTNLETFKQWVLFLHKVFPDFHVTIEDTIAEDDKIVKRWRVTGTQKDTFMGIPPTGNGITLEGIAIYRFEEDKIAELWWGYDVFGMLQQLGAFPPKE